MNIYCETNFILEIVFSQEQSNCCEKIVSLCRKRKIKLIIPAYSFAESLYKLDGQNRERELFRKDLITQINELSRTKQYDLHIQNFRSLEIFLIQNIEEEKKRFERCRKDLTKIAEIIPFDGKNLKDAKFIESKYDLTPQDAIVFSCVLSHLRQNKLSQNCFLNRNSKDFDDKSIRNRLKNLNCKFFADFEKAYNFIESQVK